MMVVAVLGTTSSLRFFEIWNFLVELCYEEQDSFLFCFVGGVLVCFLHVSLLGVCC